MKYLKLFEVFNKLNQDQPKKEFTVPSGEDLMNYSDHNKYFDLIYACVVRNTSGLKRTIQISKPEHPLSASGNAMAGLYSYDAFTEVETPKGKLSIYFGGKGSPPKGEPIPDYIEFKKVYTKPDDLQNDQDRIQSISQNKKGFQFDLEQIENGWKFRIERLSQKLTDRDYKLAENLTEFITRTFR